MGGEAKRRKEKYGALYGTPECPGAGMTEKLREQNGPTVSLAKFLRQNEDPINKKRESKRFEKRHGFKRERYEIERDGGVGNDGGSSGYED